MLYLFRIPVRNLAELRARATAEFGLIYISWFFQVKMIESREGPGFQMIWGHESGSANLT